jgi:hypothetical protein
MDNQLMFNEKEIALIKSTFAENDALLVAVRKLFFGQDITADEKKMITSAFVNEDVINALRRKVYGLNSFETPIGQLSDFWLGVESQIFGASRDTIYQAMVSKEMVLDMFTKAFNLLTNPDGEKVNVEVSPKIETDPLGVKIIARNLYMKAIETGLLGVKTIAGMKTESPEEAVKRLTKDSAR